ncbi:MAG: hypothetical protein ABIO79_06810, partial [Ferruginibacter sp.]
MSHPNWVAHPGIKNPDRAAMLFMFFLCGQPPLWGDSPEVYIACLAFNSKYLLTALMVSFSG